MNKRGDFHMICREFIEQTCQALEDAGMPANYFLWSNDVVIAAPMSWWIYNYSIHGIDNSLQLMNLWYGYLLLFWGGKINDGVQLALPLFDYATLKSECAIDINIRKFVTENRDKLQSVFTDMERSNWAQLDKYLSFVEETFITKRYRNILPKINGRYALDEHTFLDEELIANLLEELAAIRQQKSRSAVMFYSVGTFLEEHPSLSQFATAIDELYFV